MGISKRVTVVGVGNLLLKDEGIGVHIANALQALRLPPPVEIIDGGTSPDILTCLEPADKLVIIDAAATGGAPGTIYRFHPDELNPVAGRIVSLHEVDLLSNLRMMSLAGHTPKEVVIIGVQTKEIDWGTELSTELQDRIPEIVSVILEEIGVAVNM